MKSELPGRHAYTIAVAGGALLWYLTSAMSGTREAWDSEEYWTISYPLALALAGILGYLAPARPWRWGLTVMLTQAVMLALTAAGFGLLPLGLILFAILALPPIGIALLTAAVRRRRHG
ncbi:MAG: hypothetical protein ACU841_08140 [Gammaproteobacteria bacterium]